MGFLTAAALRLQSVAVTGLRMVVFISIYDGVIVITFIGVVNEPHEPQQQDIPICSFYCFALEQKK